MKHLFTLLIICSVVSNNFAQTTGDYQTVSNVTGNWNGATTWERYNGTSFVATATPPSSADGVITVRASANVTITSPVTTDQTIIENGGTLTQNSSLTIGNGTGDDLIVHGSWIFNNGNFIGSGNAVITATGICTIATGNNKFLEGATIINNGIINWQDGFIGCGTATSSITNNNQFSISGNNELTNVGAGCSLVNTGVISKSSIGVTQFSGSGVTLNNSGTMNFNAGIVNLNMATTNTGIWSFAGGTVNNNSNLSWNSGASITGSGAFNISGGTTNLNADISIPASLAFSVSNTSTIITGSGNLTINNDFINRIQIVGSGALIVTGNMNWIEGALGRNYTVPAGKTLSLTTGNQKNASGFNITNNGIIDWQDGFINIGDFAGTLTNNGQFNINGNNDLNSGVPFTFLNNGTITKTSTGSTTFSGGNVTFNNTGTLKGIGTINFNITGFVNNGIIAPGTSPGIFTVNNINGIQPLSVNSTLQIEMLNNSGAGTGHDQLVKNGNLTLSGTLTVIAIGTVPVGTYTIINLTSGTISGNFSTLNIPSGTTLQVNPTNVQLIVNTIVLPLNLISFSGRKQNNDVVLQWKTANEINVKQFEVQSSIDGLTFTSIGTLAVANSNYSFTDANVFATKKIVYYRLKILDIDGRFSYSNIIKLFNKPTNQITIYPNPAKDVITISGLQGKGQLQLTNMQGEVLMQQNVQAQSMVINLSTFANGTYILKYLNNKTTTIQKLIKQ